ncbi:MAG: hypothetical protein IKR37_04805 [Paludibacteraceae bacterium]|nr:hypothetical protein [Paludibacteraceae bacterium]
MARAKYTTIVNELHGATSPDSVHRQKRYRDAKGRIVGYASPEMYKVTKPRNWDQNPAVGEELVNQKLWGKACFLSAKALETDEGVEYWQKRFEAQLYATPGSKPDPFASVLPNGTKKRYVRFDAFVRGIIRNELKAAGNPNK